MSKNNAKKSLITFGVIFLIIGGGLMFASKKIVCIPFTNECMLITEGDNLFNARGIRIDQNTAGIIQTSPYIVLGLGGIFLLAGLIKPNEN